MTTKKKKKMKKEIEVKIEIPKDKISNLIKRLFSDLKVKKMPVIEQKVYGFFTPDGSSIKNGIFPRIRIDNGISTLTVKLKKHSKSNYFEREEYTIEIDSFNNGSKILKALGYTRCEYFSKTRTPFFYKKGAELCLDFVPGLGHFLEIEASKKEIEKIIKLLKLEKEKRITKSYLGLIKEKKKEA